MALKPKLGLHEYLNKIEADLNAGRIRRGAKPQLHRGQIALPLSVFSARATALLAGFVGEDVPFKWRIEVEHYARFIRLMAQREEWRIKPPEWDLISNMANGYRGRVTHAQIVMLATIEFEAPRRRKIGGAK
jgi:hypothetical protein